MKKLLLHVCCGPCATEVIERLKDNYEISLFFYNPNIQPVEEYNLRLEQVKKLADIHDLELFIHEQDDDAWFTETEGLDNEPEGGRRCEKCLGLRIETAARFAADHNFDTFTSSISISPYKNHILIKRIGNRVAGKFGVDFVDDDFKKDDGYKKSIELSKKHGLYRQNYCGCIYSKK